MAATTSPDLVPPSRLRLPFRLSQEVVLVFVIIALSLVAGAINPQFWRSNNVRDTLSNISYIAVAAIGMTMVIASGNIDISVGALIGCLATVSGLLAVRAPESPLWLVLAYVAPPVLGALAGAVNGFLVAFLRIPAIVVTLGMFSIFQGALILTTRGNVIYDLPAGFTLAQQRPLGIPAPIYFMVILTIIGAVWMRYSTTGRAIYAVGGNKEAARLSGISERKIVMTAFILNGVTAGIATLLYATQQSVIQPTVPAGLELKIITACVVGGVSILGGTGTIVGAMLGSILINTIFSVLIFTDTSKYWIQAVQGVLILITVLVDMVRRQRESFSGR
jgi:ribose/xylose/arabinose/galactoside ABC-type transport system permease subunit